MLMFGTIGCVHSKDLNGKKISMLKAFYISYNAIWESDLNFLIKIHQLDSMREEYCSKTLNTKLKEIVEDQGYDHDIMIGDISANKKHLQDISIIENELNKNWFIISYIGVIEDFNFKPVDIEVKLEVEIIEENDSYKINDVRRIR